MVLLAAFVVLLPATGVAQPVVSLRDAVALAVRHDSRVLEDRKSVV